MIFRSNIKVFPHPLQVHGAATTGHNHTERLCTSLFLLADFSLVSLSGSMAPYLQLLKMDPYIHAATRKFAVPSQSQEYAENMRGVITQGELDSSPENTRAASLLLAPVLQPCSSCVLVPPDSGNWICQPGDSGLCVQPE